MKRWLTIVQGTVIPAAMPMLELVDHLPSFLDEILASVRRQTSEQPLLDESTTAAEHGKQRLRLGFSLDSVVREYGALRNAVIETARDTGEQLSFHELQVLFDWIVAGIADAVSEYSRQHDSEMLRRANEHFAFVAHELATPLATATLAFGALKAKGALPADQREVTVLERSLLRSNELLEQTLRGTRASSGVELQKEWTTLAEVFEDVELGANLAAEGKGVTVDVAIARDDRMHVDVRLLRSAVSNLVRNAIKYTQSHSHVTLRGDIAKGHAQIEIEDRCGGLAPGKVEEVFAPFVRLDTAERGFGLGLAIARQAVDAHGGTLRVQNLPGKGCIFVLEVPTGAAGN
jgi:hypothetical protein